MQCFICKEFNLELDEALNVKLGYYLRRLKDNLENFIVQAIRVCIEKEQKNLKYFYGVMNNLINHKIDDEDAQLLPILINNKIIFSQIKKEELDEYYTNYFELKNLFDAKALISSAKTYSPFIFTYYIKPFKLFDEIAVKQYLKREDRYEDALLNIMIYYVNKTNGKFLDLVSLNSIHNEFKNNNITTLDDAILLANNLIDEIYSQKKLENNLKMNIIDYYQNLADLYNVPFNNRVDENLLYYVRQNYNTFSNEMINESIKFLMEIFDGDLSIYRLERLLGEAIHLQINDNEKLLEHFSNIYDTAFYLKEKYGIK
jgi:hypothetical protein